MTINPPIIAPSVPANARQINSVLATLAALLLMASIPTSAEVPIDSPRGNYEGADNIHWYQQQNLDEMTYRGATPRSGAAFRCNPDNLFESCFGYPIVDQLSMYYAQGRVPFSVAIWVDSRQTEGFDYGFRRALREIRQINDTLSRSGVNTQVYVSAIQYKDMSDLSFSAPDIWDHYSSNEPSAVAYAIRHRADAVMIIRNAEDANNLGYCGTASVGVGNYWLPIIVLTCVYDGVENEASNAPYAAAHEFGHILGAGHNRGDGSVVAFIDHGYGYYDETNNTNTIMSTVLDAFRIPIYSSPNAVWNGVVQGDTNSANAVSALNDAATTAALFYETKWGSLSSANDGTGSMLLRAERPRPPTGVE